jgi:hypothetical protein
MKLTPRYLGWLVMVAGVTIAISLRVAGHANTSAGGKRDFEAAVGSVLSALRRGDVQAFSRFASKEGVLVSRRRVDWDRTGTPLRDAASGEAIEQDYLYLKGLEPLVWEEFEVGFQRSEISGPEFAAILRQFHSFLLATESDYRGTTVSRDMVDHWASRRLGPAVEGKLLSDVFWYVYFVREDGSWRVWKLEHVTH